MSLLAALLVALVRVYQLTLSRVLVMVFGPVCRFEPSCSRYAIECLKSHGALFGSLLSARRLCRCHPFHPGGFDPPPPPRGTAGLSFQPPSRACRDRQADPEDHRNSDGSPYQ